MNVKQMQDFFPTDWGQRLTQMVDEGWTVCQCGGVAWWWEAHRRGCATAKEAVMLVQLKCECPACERSFTDMVEADLAAAHADDPDYGHNVYLCGTCCSQEDFIAPPGPWTPVPDIKEAV